MATKKKSGPGINLFLILIIFGVFVGAGYFLYQEGQKNPGGQIVIGGKSKEQTSREYMEALTAKYGEKTIQYIDTTYGYKIRFPIGYEAKIDPFPDIHQRFVAYYPPYSIELYDIRILKPSELSESDILDGAKEGKIPLVQEKIAGKTAYLINSKEQNLINENETIYLRQAFFNCQTPQGKAYWLSFTAGISEALVGDVEVADYMIRTIEC